MFRCMVIDVYAPCLHGLFSLPVVFKQTIQISTILWNSFVLKRTSIANYSTSHRLDWFPCAYSK